MHVDIVRATEVLLYLARSKLQLVHAKSQVMLTFL